MTWPILEDPGSPRWPRPPLAARPPGLPGVGQPHDGPSAGRQHLQPQGHCHAPWMPWMPWMPRTTTKNVV